MSITAIILAAGMGSRANLNFNKVLYSFNGSTVLEKAIEPFFNNKQITQIIVAASEKDVNTIKTLTSKYNTEIIIGGKTRTESVYNCLKKATGEIVLIHDAARPYVSSNLINKCIETVKTYNSAIPVVPQINTISEIDLQGYIISSKRNGFYNVQTPQGFYTKDILLAYSKINNESFTDDASVYLKYISSPKTFEGEENNIKLTYKNDFITQNYLCGTGFDLHRLVENRKLILGGVEIPYIKGLLGHSDADVLLHSIMDALLSALSLGDIGKYFPDTDKKYLNVDSSLLLKEVLKMINLKGYKIKNVSSAIMAEKPKLQKYVLQIREKLSELLNINIEYVGITCTTLEGLGIVGREEGIATQSYVLLQKI